MRRTVQQPACLHPSLILFLCFSASHPPGRRNVETECFKNSILSCDRRCPGGSAALWCEKQECEDGCRPRRAAGPIHAHHQGPQNRRPGVQERVRLFFRLSRKCACRPPPHTHTHSVRHERLVWGEKVRRRRADSLFCTSSAAHVNLL